MFPPQPRASREDLLNLCVEMFKQKERYSITQRVGVALRVCCSWGADRPEGVWRRRVEASRAPVEAEQLLGREALLSSWTNKSSLT